MTLVQKKSRQAIQTEWQAHLRNNAGLFQSDAAPPGQLHFLASLYFGITGTVGTSARDRLRRYLGDDALAKLALDALARVPSRPDLPSVQEAFDLYARDRRPFLALPLLAGIEECSTRGGRKTPLPDDRLRQALTIYAFYGPPSGDEPQWHRWAVTHKPQLVAETTVAVHRAALRCNWTLYHAPDLVHDPDYEEVARLSVPPLLRAFPARARSDQLAILISLLAAALSHCDEDEFCTIVDGKLTAKSMGARQKMHWICAGLLRRPATYLPSLERELERGVAQRRVRYAAEFLGSHGVSSRLTQLDIGAAGLLIERIGPAWRPFPDRYPAYGTNPGETVVPHLIDVAAKTPAPEATERLRALAKVPALAPWHERLKRAARYQRNLRRNTEFSFPSVRAVASVLEGNTPATAADLAALAYHELTSLGRNIRDGQTSDWRQYWRMECDSWQPQRETDCRDRLLSDLKPRLLRFDVMADIEPSYADGKRADIRISYDCFNVPIEIKKSNSKDLWIAVRGQLIPKYTRDPGAGGNGIFLVFWFGQQFCTLSKLGKRPASADALQAMLVDSLPTDVQRRVKVLVVDVSRPSRT